MACFEFCHYVYVRASCTRSSAAAAEGGEEEPAPPRRTMSGTLPKSWREAKCVTKVGGTRNVPVKYGRFVGFGL